MYRHGDVLLIPVSTVPPAAAPAERWDGVLVEGEVTGHTHRVTTTATRLLRHDGQMYLVLDAPAELRHEEHAAILLQPGAYQVIRQREYEPERIRNVVD